MKRVRIGSVGLRSKIKWAVLRPDLREPTMNNSTWSYLVYRADS